MSPIAPKVALLALASTAVAVPFGHGHQHDHDHQHHHLHHTGRIGTGTGSPYGIANATGLYPSGSGVAASTGFATAVSTVVVANTDVVAVAAASADSSSTTCTDSVFYTTVTNRKTLYVTATGGSVAVSSSSSSSSSTISSSVESSSTISSSVEASTESSASLTLSVAQKQHGAHRTHTTTAAAAAVSTTSSSVAVSTSSSSTSVVVAATVATSSTSSASSSSSSSTSTSGKRGAAYNDALLCDLLEDASQVTWGYNWGQSSAGLSSSFNYVPMLWGDSSTFTDDWSSSAQSAIDDGATHLMSFNEPDLSSQSDLTPAAAAAAWKTYMEPFAGKAKLGAPAVTNGAGAMGLDWLDAFITECSDCTIDFVSIHWYSTYDETAYFKEQVANATSVAGGLPVWVTEFGCTDGTDAEISSFLEEVMPWMDEQSYVERYAYFMVATDYLLSSTTELSTYGSTYLSYSS